MSQNILLSGVGDLKLFDSLRQVLKTAKPQVVGIASAFVSIKGVEKIADIFKYCGLPECKLIAGTHRAITHPEALYTARKLGWDIRLGSAPHGIFHPKIIIAGKKMSADGVIADLSCLYVGSSNLTGGGLSANVECGLIADEAECPESASSAFATLWGIPGKLPK